VCFGVRVTGSHRGRPGIRSGEELLVADTIEDQLVSYLKDAHALEQMSLQMTKSAAEAADALR
jgi:hypothetical protein